jgi:hypothetical protein
LLLKKTQLTAREYELMKRHPLIGDDLCRPVKSLEAVRPIVRQHHERLDGRGYPDRLSGDCIPPVAQIVTVVDVFDALTSDRRYRRALPIQLAWADDAPGSPGRRVLARSCQPAGRSALLRPPGGAAPAQVKPVGSRVKSTYRPSVRRRFVS